MKKISKPNERWQSQQKAAWAKLARSEAPDQQVEDFAEQMIAEHSPEQRAVRDLAAKLAVTPAVLAAGISERAQKMRRPFGPGDSCAADPGCASDVAR